MSVEISGQTADGRLSRRDFETIKSRAEYLRGLLDLDEPWTVEEFKEQIGWSPEHNAVIRKLQDTAIEVEKTYSPSDGWVNEYTLTEDARRTLEDMLACEDRMPNCECRWHVPSGDGPEYECKYCGAACTRDELEAAR